MTVDPIAFVEAAYRFEQDRSAWLQGVAESARPLLDQGFGVMCTASNLEADGVRHLGDGLAADGDAVHEAGLGVAADSPMHVWRGLIARSHEATTAVTRIGAAAFEDHFQPMVARGVRDVFGVPAVDPGGHSLIVGAPLARSRAPDRHEVTLWRHLAVHAMAGWRLREDAAHHDEPRAVLSPDGRRVVHAVGEATSTFHREALRVAARAMDRARGRIRRDDPGEALALWRGLVASRWSLVDHFESDGRRFVVARRNAPACQPEAALTPRQVQVAHHAALGHSNKLIAYELGLAPRPWRRTCGGPWTSWASTRGPTWSGWGPCGPARPTPATRASTQPSPRSGAGPDPALRS